MLHAGLDLSRKRLDVCLIDEGGEIAGLPRRLTWMACAAWSSESRRVESRCAG
jgi:hypothetical protein